MEHQLEQQFKIYLASSFYFALIIIIDNYYAKCYLAKQQYNGLHLKCLFIYFIFIPLPAN